MRRTSSTLRLTPALVALLLPLVAMAWAGAAPIARSAGTAASRAPRLVQDIDPAPYQPRFQLQEIIFATEDRAYFAASDERGESGLWSTDGTGAGTRPATSQPLTISTLVQGDSAMAGGSLYLVADDGSSGAELWRSDGTAAGTFLVRDVRPGPAGGLSYPAVTYRRSLAALGDTLLFAADDGVHGPELWRSDGTAAGTVMVKDLRPGVATWAPDLLTVAGASVYFRTAGGTAGDTIWRSDGTAAGTTAIRIVSPGPFNSPGVYGLEAVGASLFISHWEGLFRSDGTEAGTRLIDATAIGAMAAVGERLVYTANGAELRATDGTPGGAVRLAILGSAQSTFLGAAGGAEIIFVPGPSPGAPAALWRSDGTPSGTFKLVDVQATGGAPGATKAGALVFGLAGAPQSAGPDQLWYSDGSAAGTFPIVSTTPIGSFGQPAPVAGGWVFRACDAAYACSLMRTNGTAAGTAPVIPGNVNPLLEPKLTPAAAGSDGLLYYTHPDLSTLLRSDGTPEGTLQLKAYLSGRIGAFGEFEALDRTLYFSAIEGRTWKLWRSDGTPGGTAVLKEVPAYQLTPALGALYFSSDHELWRSDGTAAGTVPITTVGTAGPAELAGARHTLYMIAQSATLRSELWRSDGTARGTALVRAFDVIGCGFRTCEPSTARGLVAAGEAVFFTARAEGGQEGLWRSDGSAAGTVQLTTSAPAELTAVGDAVFFTMSDEAGAELWRSDGTPAGTARVRDILPGPDGSLPQGLTAIDGALFFSASDGQSGRELWASDGSAAGTRMVADLAPGFAGSVPAGLAAGGATLYFSAWSPGAGRELWASDGSAAGTRMVADLAPGLAGSSPAQLTAAGPQLYFTANDGVTGPALWVAPVASAPFRPTRVAFGALIQAEEFDRGSEGLAYHDRDPQNRGGRLRPDEGVDLEPAGDAGGGHLVGWTQAGEWLNYTVDLAATRVYTLEVRVASLGPGGVFHIALDGEDWTGPLLVPDTGGWDRWATVGRAGLTLPAGRHTLSLVMDQDGATWGVGNFNWLALRAPAEHTMLMPGAWR